jgi:hypothetical protein
MVECTQPFALPHCTKQHRRVLKTLLFDGINSAAWADAGDSGR